MLPHKKNLSTAADTFRLQFEIKSIVFHHTVSNHHFAINLTLTVMTPFLPTFFIADEMSSPIFDSPFAEIVPTCKTITKSLSHTKVLTVYQFAPSAYKIYIAHQCSGSTLNLLCNTSIYFDLISY